MRRVDRLDCLSSLSAPPRSPQLLRRCGLPARSSWPHLAPPRSLSLASRLARRRRDGVPSRQPADPHAVSHHNGTLHRSAHGVLHEGQNTTEQANTKRSCPTDAASSPSIASPSSLSPSKTTSVTVSPQLIRPVNTMMQPVPCWPVSG